MSLIIKKDLTVIERLRVECKWNGEVFVYCSSVELKYDHIDFYNYDEPKRMKENETLIEIIFDEYDRGISIFTNSYLEIDVDFEDNYIEINNTLSRNDIYKQELRDFENYLEKIEEDVIENILKTIPESERDPLSDNAMQQIKEQTTLFREAFKAEWESECEKTVMRAINEIVYFTKPVEEKPKQNDEKMLYKIGNGRYLTVRPEERPVVSQDEVQF